MKDVSVIIVNWNTKSLLRNCLSSVIDQTNKCSYDIWVVDNNSPDNSAEMVRKEFPGVKLIANTVNNGFAKANNQALRVAESKYYLLLNPDTLVIDNAIDRMYEYMESTSTEALTCKLLNDDLTLQRSVNNFFSLSGSLLENRFFGEAVKRFNSKSRKLMMVWDHNSTAEIDWAHGAVIMISDNVLRNVGLLDENFYIYAEEIDYYMRIRKAGIKAIYNADIKIIHYGKSSSRQRRSEMFIQNYKSFYLFLKKHYDGYVYPVYRLRTMLYLHLWIAAFSIEFLLRSLTFQDAEESKAQIKIYFQTLRWHLKKESLIKA